MSMLKPRWLTENRGSGTRPQIGLVQAIRHSLYNPQIGFVPIDRVSTDYLAYSYLAGPVAFGGHGRRMVNPSCIHSHTTKSAKADGSRTYTASCLHPIQAPTTLQPTQHNLEHRTTEAVTTAG